ncbi:MAG TPA: DoxX family protein [Gaiellaceae bacterium]|nr:DoxX family protein [Gaiellaceae bacterium]
MGIGKLALRVTLGGYFFGHGMQKLAGWFGGAGPEGTGQFFERAGLRPGREAALVAGAAEAGGGSLLALGLGTPAAVSLLTGVMTNAIRYVHWKRGLWNANGGIELPAVILAALAVLADGGPGPYSLDEALGWRASGSRVLAWSMGGGAAGALLLGETGHVVLPAAATRLRRLARPAGAGRRTEAPVPAAG